MKPLASVRNVSAWEKKLGTKSRLRRTSKMRGQSTCGLVVPASSANLLFSPNAGRCVGSVVIIGSGAPPSSRARMMRGLSRPSSRLGRDSALRGTKPLASVHNVSAWERFGGTRFRLWREPEEPGRPTCGFLSLATPSSLRFSPNAGRCARNAVSIGRNPSHSPKAGRCAGYCAQHRASGESGR